MLKSGKNLSWDFEVIYIFRKNAVLNICRVLADLDFADDIALLSDEIAQAQELLLTVEKECKKVGLVLNAKKTKSVAYNIDNPTPLHTLDGTYLEWKDDFKYLESFEWYDENMEVQYE